MNDNERFFNLMNTLYELRHQQKIGNEDRVKEGIVLLGNLLTVFESIYDTEEDRQEAESRVWLQLKAYG